MLCRILMWEGRFCVFVTVASAFSGFRPWVRKYPSIFAHCLKYNFFLAESVYWWIIMHVFGVFWLDLLFLFLGFFSGLKPTKDVRKRCLSMSFDGPRHMVFDWYRLTSTIASRMILDTDSFDVLDWFRTRLLCIEISRGNSRSQSNFIVFFRILRFLLG